MLDGLVKGTMQKEVADWLGERPELVSWLREHKGLAEWMNQNKEFIQWVEYYKDKRVGIKYGAVIEHGLAAAEIAEEIIFSKLCGMYPNVVHGGSTYINDTLKQAFPGYEPDYTDDGDRITDGVKKSTVAGKYYGKTEVEIVHQVLSAISNEIIELLEKYVPEGMGVKAVGTSPEEPLFLCTQKSKEAGFVGKIEYLEEKLLYTLYDKNIIPVYPPLGYAVGKDGWMGRLNINGDRAASYLASFYYDKGGLYVPQANNLIFVTSSSNVTAISGLENSGEPTELPTGEVRTLIGGDWFNKGRRTKLQACVDAYDRGVKKIQVVSGELERSYTLLYELFTKKGRGILITGRIA